MAVAGKILIIDRYVYLVKNEYIESIGRNDVSDVPAFLSRWQESKCWR